VLIEEAIVDAYCASEQISGFSTMIENSPTVPFKAEKVGIAVTVEDLQLTEDDQIIAVCARGKSKQRIPCHRPAARWFPTLFSRLSVAKTPAARYRRGLRAYPVRPGRTNELPKVLVGTGAAGQHVGEGNCRHNAGRATRQVGPVKSEARKEPSQAARLSYR